MQQRDLDGLALSDLMSNALPLDGKKDKSDLNNVSTDSTNATRRYFILRDLEFLKLKQLTPYTHKTKKKMLKKT